MLFQKFFAPEMIASGTCSTHEFAHKSYTIKHERTTICQIEALIAAGSNIASACRQVNIDRSVFYQ